MKSRRLPSDWPAEYVDIVKDHARAYFDEIHGEWAVEGELRSKHVDAIARKIDEDLRGDSEPGDMTDAWHERFEQGNTHSEIRAALPYYADKMRQALRKA